MKIAAESPLSPRKAPPAAFNGTMRSPDRGRIGAVALSPPENGRKSERFSRIQPGPPAFPQCFPQLWKSLGSHPSADPSVADSSLVATRDCNTATPVRAHPIRTPAAAEFLASRQHRTAPGRVSRVDTLVEAQILLKIRPGATRAPCSNPSPSRAQSRIAGSGAVANRRGAPRASYRTRDEGQAHVPTEYPPPRQGARVPHPHVDQERAYRPETASRQGTQAPHCRRRALIGMWADRWSLRIVPAP